MEGGFTKKYTFIPEMLTLGQKCDSKMGVLGPFGNKTRKKACVYKIFIVSLWPIS